MTEELYDLLLVILAWLLTDHDPLLDNHLHARCHLMEVEPIRVSKIRNYANYTMHKFQTIKELNYGNKSELLI